MPAAAAAADGWLGALIAFLLRPSNVDWCESNYAVHSHVAEWWNTLSSLPIAGLALFGLLHARPKASLEPRWLAVYALTALCGIGSVAFHATLRVGPQALDELPMLYCALVLTYIVLETGDEGGKPEPRRAPRQRRWPGLRWALVAVGALETAAYITHTHNYRVFFGFALAGAGVVTVLVGIKHRALAAALASRRGPAAARLRTALARCHVVAAVTNVSATLCWWMDNTFCAELGQLPQLHAVWHVLSAISAFALVQWALLGRAAAKRRDADLGPLPLPYARIRPPINADGS